MLLPERLAAVAAIVKAENDALARTDIDGFYPYDPHTLTRVAQETLPHIAPDAASLDMGAGTGAWWLLMAAAGVASYAIEIHPELVAACERLRATCIDRGLIDPATPCEIACGDMIPPEWRDAYRAFRTAHGEVERSMPGDDGSTDAYATLGIALNGFGTIYCWAWPTQSRFVYNMLADTVPGTTLLILPSYVRYTQGEHMNASMREPNRLALRIVARASETAIGYALRD